MDLFGMLLCRRFPDVMLTKLLAEIAKENQGSQPMTSLISIAGYTIVGSGAPELSKAEQVRRAYQGGSDWLLQRAEPALCCRQTKP